MFKNKFCLFFTIAFIFNLYNISSAVENINIKSNYPDYSYEFSGKDSWESFNRKIFVFNLKANKYVIRPINIIWASIIPQYGIDRIESFYTNLSYPVRLVGCLLQKDFKSSGTETVRFLTNTTIGLVGLYDPASSKFKIKPSDEDVAQAFAHYNMKPGPYLVLPIVAQGNVRDIAGQIADFFLNPCFYIAGPITAISAGVSVVNNTTSMQPIFKMADNYADSYEASKQLYGIDDYIKNKNLDRENFFTETPKNQNIVEVKNISDNNLKADIELNDYNSQGPLIDSLRSILFDCQNLNDSIWSDLSVWNKSFIKKIKTSSVNIDPLSTNYKYRYVMQQDKTSPVAIIYPSIGENITSSESTVQAKLLYDAGYSVVILGSPFQWEFVKSMPENYRPGLPSQDAYYLRKVTSIILNQIQGKYACQFRKKILVGTSFGGLTTLFVAAQEENENTLGISNYISINPPVELFFALNQIDKYFQDLGNNASDIKLKAAMTDEKIIQLSQRISNRKNKDKIDTLPLTEDEAKLAISFVMKQKLSDVIFTIEKGSLSKKSNLHELTTNMNFYDYANKYLLINRNKSVEELTYESGLYSLADFLKKNKNYKIYHSLDDCYVNTQQLFWLKNQTGNKSVFFDHGSHLGYLYRKEFIDEFNKDIKL